MKILVAVDGSEMSLRAVKKAAALAKAMAEAPTLVLLHADAPLMRRVAAQLGVEATQRYHAGNAELALKPARAALRRAGVAFVEKPVIGDPAPAILKLAKSGKFDLVVMGSHGRGALGSALMGSVAAKVLSHGDVPLLLVR